MDDAYSKYTHGRSHASVCTSAVEGIPGGLWLASRSSEGCLSLQPEALYYDMRAVYLIPRKSHNLVCAIARALIVQTTPSARRLSPCPLARSCSCART
jgi:hypothetical protein